MFNSRKRSLLADVQRDGSSKKKSKLKKTGRNVGGEILKLNSEQEAAVRYALKGKNMFLSGSAGSGKSFTLRTVIKRLRESGKIVEVTATTGVAAVQVGGSTIYKCFKIHPVKHVEKNALRKSETWRKLDVLVIEEVSQCTCELFSYLDRMARLSRTRSSGEPFGGVQIILCGDFFQLPPVRNKSSGPNDPMYIFQTPEYRALFSEGRGVNILLTQIYRQADRDFVDMLERLRRAQLTSADIDLIDENCMPSDSSPELCRVDGDPQITRTKLFVVNARVEEENKRNLDRIGKHAEEHKYPVKFSFGKVSDTRKTDIRREFLKNQFPADGNSAPKKVLLLKTGAQVMLIANLDVANGLANGSRGVVIGFRKGYPVVKFRCGRVARIARHVRQLRDGASADFVLLRLAYALTVHKSQGQSIDWLEIDLLKCWEAGQAYTAFSRATSMEGLVVRNFTNQCVIASPLVTEFYDNLMMSE